MWDNPACPVPGNHLDPPLQIYPVNNNRAHPLLDRLVLRVTDHDNPQQRQSVLCGLITHEGAAEKNGFKKCERIIPSNDNSSPDDGDCGEGQSKNQDGKCAPTKTDCPPGQSSKGVQKRCVPDDDACPKGLSKGQDGRCVEKPTDEGKRAERDGKAEEEKKAAEDKKAAKDKKAEDNKNGKVGRMGKCVGLVSMAMPMELAKTFADNFFSEDVLAGEELMEFWPSHLQFDPSVDGKLDNDQFIDQYTDSVVTSKMNAQQRENFKTIIKRSGAALEGGPVEVDVSTEHLEKRALPAVLGVIVSFLARLGAGLARAASRAGSRAGGAFRRAFTAAGQGAGKPKAEQLAAIRDHLTKDSKWVECLTGVLSVASQFA